MELKERLRVLRKEKKETQKQLAAIIGVGYRHYQRFESGENDPTFKDLCALADHFGVSFCLAGQTNGRRTSYEMLRKIKGTA